VALLVAVEISLAGCQWQADLRNAVPVIMIGDRDAEASLALAA
jgi:hypothetical protein